jgi:hypothetical protein
VSVAPRCPGGALDPGPEPRVVAIELGPDEFEISENDLKQVVEVVRDATGQLADGLHPLRLAQHTLGLGALGHVGHGEHEAAIGHRRAANLQVMRVGADPLVDHGLAGRAVAVAELVLALQRGTAVFRGVLGEGGVGRTKAQHRLGDVEKHLEAMVPVRHPVVGAEHRDALAQAVEGGAQAQRQRALLGLYLVGARPGLIEEARRDEQDDHGEAGAAEHQPAHPGRAGVVLR